MTRAAVLRFAVAMLAVCGILAAANGPVANPAMVCMMQDMVLTKPGIAVEHGGKTYYGCCDMCKQRIASDPEKYTKAKDPVSGKVVDKASALIYGLEGTAFYFESKQTRAQFAKDPKKYVKP